MAIKVSVVSRLPEEAKTTLAIILTQIALMKNKTVLAVDLDEQNNFNFNTSMSYLQKEPNFKHRFILKTSLTKEDFYSSADWIIVDCPYSASGSYADESTKLALRKSDFVIIIVEASIYSMDSRTDLFSLMSFSEIRSNAGGYKELFQFPLVKIGFIGNPQGKFADAIIAYQYERCTVIGNLPPCKTITANISSDRKKWWSVGLQAQTRKPFELIYTRLELLHKKLQA